MALILIADDNAENRYVLDILLQRTGFGVASAANGQEAYDKACDTLPDMIVSDILMPVMDGFTLCKKCKSHPDLRNIPFVFYTATYTEPKDIEFGLSLGAEKFLIKPMEAESLLKVLTDVLTNHRAADSEPQDPVLEKEMELLKQYNETLFRKLQKKVNDLESANQLLRQEMEKRLLTENSLRQSEARLKLLLNSLPVGFAWADKKDSFRFVNEKFTEFFGYTAQDTPCVDNSFPLSFPDEMTGNTFLSTWSDAIKVSGTTGKPTNPFEVRVSCKNGEVRDISVIGAVIEDLCLAIFSDMTEHKRLQEQLAQAQKLESIGNLAGGIAHDFNNILTSITGFAGLLQMKMDSSSPLLAHVKEVISAGLRGAALTNQLLAFSRKQILDMKPVDLNTTMAGLTKMLRRLIREDVALTFDLSTSPLSVMADGNQVGQVVINLVTNARDAMPNGGSIVISTGIASVDDSFIRKHGEGEIGKYALISIRDNGVGMNADLKSKIFEPFFTTKEIGKGTGLGLSVVYGIIRQHRGMIFVDSTPGKGTLFTVYLPLLREGVEVIEESNQELEGKTGTETVLIAEDNETLRKLARHVLESHGYTVIAAEDGKTALTLFREHKNAIQLSILDLTMPGKRGYDVYKEISGEVPHAKVLFVTGYSADEVGQAEIRSKSLPLLMKPYTPFEFLRQVRAALDNGR